MNFEYFLVVSFIFLSFGLALILFLLFFFLIFRQNDFEKISAYECGFNPFEDAYGRFDVRFYLVAILFLIMDLEVAFLLPWSSSLAETELFGGSIVFIFLTLLILGLVYEWKKGALEWK